MIQLPNELIFIIFEFIGKITDKRHFLRTCKLYNTITKGIFKISENILNIYLSKNEFGGKYKNYCVENFTLELCHDSYFDMIPTRYFNKNNKILMSLLIKHGKLDLLKIAVSNGCSVNVNTCNNAAYFGQLDILKWIWENGHTWSGSICAAAARYGHLDILKWARGNLCKWDEFTCSYAAMNGHLDVLIWARENGCKWDSNTFEYAKQFGQLEVLDWAIENGCP